MAQTTCDVVVIGGGVAGLSTAMQLARRNAKVVVVERGPLGNGSTGRAAGLLGQLRGNAEHTRMLIDGVGIVNELEARSGLEIFVRTGSLRVAETPERAAEIRDLVQMGKSIDFDIDHLPIDEVQQRLPYMRTDDLVDACYCPTDGHLQPAELVSAYVKVGRELGVTYKTNERVCEILTAGDRVQGVRTSTGDEYHAPVVVNAGGPWSYLNAELIDTVLPTAAIGHYYLTTRPIPEVLVPKDSPAIRDRHLRIYSRPEAGGLIVGCYEAEPDLHEMAKLPRDFDMSTMKPARDSLHVAILLDAASQRFPWISPKTPMTLTVGIMTFTPDGRPFCGELPNLRGMYHCAGFSGHGIVQSPAIGVIMAELILEGKTRYDIESIEADRYYEMDGYQQRDEIEQRCLTMAGNYYGKVERPAGTSAS
ncbi:NAD(P)/FAD-dependent oxidoreductase [Aeoliella mucimassa]|uniref:4-methylaminobutanoate oxidase (Formaldehyde-forming) n=1 Tax=Aeoliella mucimassa TaxID=2527972 RepID=A0A518AQQ8_9BACT|nr:FAD-binding oxidoreductase [Aeoliella mucimassa]QDU57043.1 4-methylaminobutanoate oxidase (formaldehyde-forming) [Aeoliella mucimassa]